MNDDQIRYQAYRTLCDPDATRDAQLEAAAVLRQLGPPDMAELW